MITIKSKREIELMKEACRVAAIAQKEIEQEETTKLFEETETEDGKKEIYLPWKNFNNSFSDLIVKKSAAHCVCTR